MDVHVTSVRMAEAASDLLAGLAADQRAAIAAPFPAWDERTRWNYTPEPPRAGLALFAMEPRQQRLAMKLVATGLSEGAYNVAAVIIGLERVLDRRETWKRSGPGRDPLRYWTRIFGEPSPSAPWGWSFEGHHVALHYTLDGGRVVSPTPTFFGANPAESPLVGGKLRPLGPVEDVARELVLSLDEEQRAIAIVSGAAPRDLVTGNAPRVVVSPVPVGLAARAMSAAQRAILDALVDLYVSRLPDDIAETERAAHRARGTDGLALPGQGASSRIRGIITDSRTLACSLSTTTRRTTLTTSTRSGAIRRMTLATMSLRRITRAIRIERWLAENPRPRALARGAGLLVRDR